MSAAPKRTPAQNRAIHATLTELRSKSGLSSDDAAALLRAACVRASGQEHSSSLTPGQAATVLSELRAEVNRYTPAPSAAPAPARRPKAEHVEKPVTPRQVTVLSAMFSQLGMALPARVAFCERVIKAKRVSTQRHYTSIVNALEAMLRRKHTAPELIARLDACEPSRLDTFLQVFVPDFRRQLDEQGMAAFTAAKLAKLMEAEAACAVAHS